MKYRYRVNKRKRFVYFINPKCATRTIQKIFKFRWCSDCEYDVAYSEYFNWVFVRNPYDRIVSAYENKVVANHERGLEKFRNKGHTFESFVHELNGEDLKNADIHVRHQHRLFPIKHINFIGKFETLQQDFNTICNHINISTVQLPHINKSKHKHYTEYYNDETRKIVTELYAKDIELFKYKFENKI